MGCCSDLWDVPGSTWPGEHAMSREEIDLSARALIREMAARELELLEEMGYSEEWRDDRKRRAKRKVGRQVSEEFREELDSLYDYDLPDADGDGS